MNVLKAAKYTNGQELIGAIQDEHYLKLMEMFNQEVAHVTEQLDEAYEQALEEGLVAEAQTIHEASEAWAWKNQVFDLEAFAQTRELEQKPSDEELPPQDLPPQIPPIQ